MGNLIILKGIGAYITIPGGCSICDVEWECRSKICPHQGRFNLCHTLNGMIKNKYPNSNGNGIDLSECLKKVNSIYSVRYYANHKDTSKQDWISVFEF